MTFLRPLTKSLALAIPALLLSACAGTTDAPAKASAQPASEVNRPKVALVLGGGGTRGFAHIGVIEALEANGIKPDIVVGTSAGAFVGSIYASGKTPAELTHLADALKDTDVIDISPSKQGFVLGQRLRSYVNTQTGNKPMQNFPIRFAAVATEMQTKQAVTFSTGEAGLAVQASASVPSVFIPPRIPENGGKKYIDGSAAALLPARIAKSMGADVVIAVDLMAKADEAAAQKPAKKTTTPVPSSIDIVRTDAGVSARFGDKDFTIPVNMAQIDELSKGMPIDLPIGDILNQVLGALPANTSIALPPEAQKLLETPHAIFEKLNNIGMNVRAKPEDIAASNVVIRPDVGNVAVYDATDRSRVIEAGRTAALSEMDNIKKAITTAQYQYVGKTQ